MNTVVRLFFIIFISSVSCVLPGFALEPAQRDKHQYHMLNPTPRELMRELSTDRPDKTESPFTVDAGHIQIETNLIDYIYDTHNPDGSQKKQETISPLVETALKVGLFNNMDIQFFISPYTYQKTKDDTEKIILKGFGDTLIRLKLNLWGNDGESMIAMGVMPFIKFPTNGANLGNEAHEGGIIIPFGVSLPHDWSMGFMAEVDFNKSAANDDYHTEYIQSLTFGHAIVGDLNGYIEFFSNTSDEDDSKWIATVDTGLTYGITKDIQLDGGVNFGVTRAADDINPFIGLSLRY